MQLKIECARRQLGTALALFISDGDPVSVHCLASGGCEVIEHFASHVDSAFITHILAEHAHLDMKELRRIQRQYWNAFKHVTGQDGKSARNDEVTLLAFSDKNNDAALFVGWTDYASATKSMPIEAQVFQAWWLAQNIDKLAVDDDVVVYSELFPDINSLSRSERKYLLRGKIEWAMSRPELLADPMTERRSLILPWP